MLSTDPVDWLIDDDGNFTFVNGQIVMASGLAGVAQLQRIRIMNVAGEWFEDLDDGVPWFERDDGSITDQQAILGEKYDVNKLLNAIRVALLSTPNTTSITYLTASFDSTTRTASVTYATETIFGDTPVNTLEMQVPA